LADLHASELTIQTAVVQGTNKKQALATENTSPPLDYLMTGSSMNSEQAKNSEYLVHSRKPSEKVDWVLQNIVKPSNPNQSEPPWIAWHRPINWQRD